MYVNPKDLPPPLLSAPPECTGDPETPDCDPSRLLRPSDKVLKERWVLAPEKFTFQKVELAKLPGYRNKRSNHKMTDIKAKMQQHHPLPPIYLRTNKPWIVNGNNRVQSARDLGFKYIWAIIEHNGPVNSQADPNEPTW